MDILKEDIKRQKELMNLQEEKTNTTKSGIVEQISGGSGFEQNQGGSDTLTKFKKRQEVGLDEQPEDDEITYLDPNQDVKSQVDSLQAKNHKVFMDGVHSMCDKIDGMGDKQLGRRRCDGNLTDGQIGGCYEPLIKLVKQYCKTK